MDYYRYSGDPAAIALVTVTADTILAHCQTPPDHPWPRFLISVPEKGRPYGKANPRGMIQLDITAEVGIGLLRAYQMVGKTEWLDAAKHWADLLATKRSRELGLPPWNRYANPEDVALWTEDQQTGGVAFILQFFEELIELGYTGKDNAIVEARDAGRAYLRDVLLPRWTVNDTWGRNYWDWPDPVQAENVTEFVVRYPMEHPECFPNWRADARNVLSLFLNRTSVAPGSKGDVYSGAWAYPESSSCCGRSLWYGPLELANVYAQYGVLADSEWGRELGRRQVILATYDCHETGVVEDGLDGGPIVAGDWFKIAHPMALKYALAAIAWLPETLGAARENHIVRSTSVVQSVIYGKEWLFYATFAAPGRSVDVLRLAFRPKKVMVDNNRELEHRSDLEANGYCIKELSGGDCLVSIRHDGCTNVTVSGDDPQKVVDDGQLSYDGTWRTDGAKVFFNNTIHVGSVPGATVTARFEGNQVRLIGSAMPDGGFADVYLDDVKQLVGIDCWSPQPRHEQVLSYRNGLTNGPHTLKVVVRGAKNPLSEGTSIYVDAVQWSAATVEASKLTFGEGGGPTDAQRWVFGYPERKDSIDARGNAWRPATEVVTRSRDGGDSVADSWWTQRRRLSIANTDTPELYRYGIHAHDFWATFTVGPGTYYARLKFAETRMIDPKLRTVTIQVNGREAVTAMDIAATAGGMGRAVDIVLRDIQPLNGVIDLRFIGPKGGEAIVQAIEVAPGDVGKGATPVTLASPASAQAPAKNLLRNPDFEGGVLGQVGALTTGGAGFGWTYVFAGPAQSYIWGESAYSIHPDWGLPVIHKGKEAIRTHTEGEGHTVIYQDVAVMPDTACVATVWVHAVDLRGKGFGRGPCDSAGLWLQELDKEGRVVVNHPKVAVRDAGAYRKLSKVFTTTKTTATVRFSLDTVIAAPYTEGHVTYDDASLMRKEDHD